MAIINVRLLAKIFVLNEKGEILLLQRSRTDERRPLGWDLPGGNVEYNEDPNQAVLRELKEEASITASDSQVFYVGTETGSHYIVTLLYSGVADSTAVTLSFEHERHQWIKPEEITDFDMPQKYVTAALMLNRE
ncbi:MAG TPA: NUDIX hydrolase [Candidatus Saccharimonadales bacterium]|nr:NUDIX hydrolase [Candidatus Saccharimonadales bacterium]